MQDKTLQDYMLPRVGLPTLKFTGTIIGQASTPLNSSDTVAFLTIRIYRTKGGKYIAEIQRQTQERSRYSEPVPGLFYRNAALCETPTEVVNWLKEGEDTLGQYSQAAVEMACQNDKDFREAWVEVVD